jgi:hypothetical protein
MTPSLRWSRGLAALTLGAASLALAGCSLLGGSNNTPTDASTDSSGDSADVFTIKVGDCLNDGAVEGEVSTVPIVDCSEPHDSEAFASIAMTDGEFPGDDAVKTQAESGCTAQFNTFVGADYSTSVLDYSYYYPTADSWAQGDREILCLVLDPAGQTTGSLKGAAR